MTVATVDGWDATHKNLPHVPSNAGQAGGYLTGSADIQWTDADKARFPDAIFYDQSTVVTDFDTTADLLDVEFGAAGDEDIVPFLVEARTHFRNGTRPGQRWPGVYCSRNRVTEVANVIVRGQLVPPVPLAVADFDHDHRRAVQEVANGSGPFPIVVRQYSDLGGGGFYDLSVYSVPWLQNRSKAMPESMTITVPPPGEWKAGTPVTVFGVGPMGQVVWVSFTTDGKHWSAPESLTTIPS